MKRTQLYKEALVASLLVIAADILLSFLPWKFELIRPIKQGFDDFSVYDLRYAETDPTVTRMDTGITLLQIGDTRQEIAEELDRIAAFHPRVVGIDAIFNNPADPHTDSSLVAAARKIQHLVIASDYFRNKDTEYVHTSFFKSRVPGVQEGSYNFVEDSVDIKRHFRPFFSLGNQPYPSLPARMLQVIAPNDYQHLLDHHKGPGTINYAGNLEHYNVVTLDRLLHPLPNEDPGDYFRDKIVFIGFFKADKPDVLEDMHFTPMNPRRGGKSFPDMYGVVIHANILEMMLGHRYVHTLCDPGVYAITFIIIFFIDIFYIRRLSRSRKHNHFLLFLLQFVLAIGLLYLSLLIFEWFNVELDPMPLLIAVVLSFEIFWLYEWLAVKMNKLFGYATFLHD